VVVGAGAKVLGPFTVGADARIGSNSVVVRAVPARATAVGIPARSSCRRRAARAGRLGQMRSFIAYGVTQGTDPLSTALHRLIDHVAEQDRKIESLQAALQKLGAALPDRAQAKPFDPGRLSKLVD
jgi:serine O-acetyltransferase